MFIEPFCKRVLFVHRQIMGGILLDSVLKQRLSSPFPPFLVRNEKHFQVLFCNSHKANGTLIFMV